jgi:hypothetical protein
VRRAWGLLPLPAFPGSPRPTACDHCELRVRAQAELKWELRAVHVALRLVPVLGGPVFRPGLRYMLHD